MIKLCRRCGLKAQFVLLATQGTGDRTPPHRRYGAPQVFAATMLLMFLIQCGGFVASVPLSQAEGQYMQRGFALLRGVRAADRHHSPLVAEAAVAGIWPLALRESRAQTRPLSIATAG